ncbi:Uncharacterized protein APZ42_032767 [Daphnia magna]|uniref:Uncharacterized protein n=1 Tax=Daphnia magna TaxID=35525 RepID=A0A164LUY6_9CRUS|nr:Uncharacterized protein APZ42_032767 [Daphnia magna]
MHCRDPACYIRKKNCGVGSVCQFPMKRLRGRAVVDRFSFVERGQLHGESLWTIVAWFDRLPQKANVIK